MNNMRLNYKKLAGQVEKLHEIAQKNGWKAQYDQELDEFYFAPISVDKKYYLRQINNDLFMYLDGDSNIGGLFIEYFINNLTSHDIKYEPFNKAIKKDNGLDKEDSIMFLSTVKAELLQALIPKITTKKTFVSKN